MNTIELCWHHNIAWHLSGDKQTSKSQKLSAAWSQTNINIFQDLGPLFDSTNKGSFSVFTKGQKPVSCIISSCFIPDTFSVSCMHADVKESWNWLVDLINYTHPSNVLPLCTAHISCITCPVDLWHSKNKKYIRAPFFGASACHK